jgi:hypothetical protein
MDLTHPYVWGMENGNLTLERLSVLVEWEQLAPQHQVYQHIMSWLFSVFHKHATVCFIPAVICDDPLYVLHIINDSTKESTRVDANNMCCSGFLIARTNTATCLENGEWELESFQTQNEGDLLEYQQYIYCCQIEILPSTYTCRKA